ncbi:MAG: hypothetical protein AAGD04_11705 [Pseudomonadota bacterium]
MKRFRRNEDGAVTVDWVMITAAVVGLAILVSMLVGGGARATADKISSNLASQTL